MRSLRASIVLSVLLVAGAAGGDAAAHKKQFPTSVQIQSVAVGASGSVSGQIGGAAKCLANRQVTVTKNGTPAGNATSDAVGEWTASGVNIASGDTIVATVAKRTVKRSRGHRHICKSASATFIPRVLTIEISKPFGGGGKVTGPGIDCSDDCSRVFNQGTSVTLTADDETAIFHQWGGDCSSSGMGPECVLVMDADKTASITFTDI